jgi:predicted nucleotidyltransferase component of viral defense system
MKKHGPKNVAASVRQRLLNRSRETGENFNFVLQRYAGERFLYRLGRSPHRDRFILKGAMLFAIWDDALYRQTRDLDFAAFGSADAEVVARDMRAICAVAVEDDGLTFDADAIQAEPIREGADYDGLRIRFTAALAGARIPMQIDVGFADAIEPAALVETYPTLLELPAPEVRAYPREAVVAEKLHAMVILGEANSRYKDFYDVYVLAREFAFDGTQVTRSITATFKRRGTPVGDLIPAALTTEFYSEARRSTLWRGFLERNDLTDGPATFVVASELLLAFLCEPWNALARNHELTATWPPGGPWRAP